MPAKSWTLTDTADNTYVENLEITPQDVGGAAKGYHIKKRRLQGGLQDGVDLIEVETSKMSVGILPTRGMGIWYVKVGQENFGWKSPVNGPVHPQFVDVGEPSGLGWLDGFDEMMVRCGLESNGAPEHDKETNRLIYPLHGRIANRPADKVTIDVDGDKGEIRIHGVVNEARFHFAKLRLHSTLVIHLDEAAIDIRDQIENVSASPGEAQMLYHANFGEPLLDAGARFVAPIKTLVPRNERAAGGIANWDSYSAPEAGFEEQVYFMELLADDNGETQTLLKNAHSTRGVSMHFNKKQLPCFTVWKNTTAIADGLVTGIEPGTNFPNPRTYEGEQERVAKLKPGGNIQFRLKIGFLTSADEVEANEKAIAKLQGNTAAKIYKEPQAGWCAD